LVATLNPGSSKDIFTIAMSHDARGTAVAESWDGSSAERVLELGKEN